MTYGDAFRIPPPKRASRTWLALIAGAGLAAGLMAGSPALAHHAFAAEYDSEWPLDLSGYVTKARWINPHSWLYFDVKGADGKVTTWAVEFGAPNALAKTGLLRKDLAPGSHVHIKGYRSKSGGPYGYSVTLTLDDGRSFQTGGAQDSPGGKAARAVAQVQSATAP